MIKQVETTVGEVNEIFVDLAGLVSEQGENVDHISTAIEKTAAQAPRSLEPKLRTPARHARCWRHGHGLRLVPGPRIYSGLLGKMARRRPNLGWCSAAGSYLGPPSPLRHATLRTSSTSQAALDSACVHALAASTSA